MSRPVHDSQDLDFAPASLRSRSDGLPREPQHQQQYGYGAGGFSGRQQLSTAGAREYGLAIGGPNRSNASGGQMSPGVPGYSSSYNHNLHQHRPSSSHIISTHPSALLYHSASSDSIPRHPAAGPAVAPSSAPPPPLLPTSTSNTSRSTLWWGDLELWMDEEYARQVCTLMGWDPVNIKVPHPPADPTTGTPTANNPGYCFLTFPSHAHAAAVLAQINNAGKQVTMPNSSKPFVLNWASSVPATATANASPSAVSGSYPPAAAQQPQYQKEYSIFVGDLAPETSNSDLVAVFRNPVLGLRNDREPKYIRPFTSCKSAKIMLDPVTGVSRGYGFVRFTDEADQQRALIEMHGLYCLSRPMRISPATAKHKNPPGGLPASPFDPSQISPSGLSLEPKPQSVTVALPLPPQTSSVSAPIAATTSNQSITSNGASTPSSSMGGSNSSTSISSNAGSNSSMTSTFGSATSSEDALSHFAKQYGGGDLAASNYLSHYANESQLRQVLQAQQVDTAPRFMVNEESWKHQAQARAILGNLIGPNGEQLTSTDPYNTTVFVGGLSPLISEETLRTFFAPFGDIHYVKVPVGKHCGFVQFVRKSDAERAIEKMQGFPIGGSKIRLSWGRSQYKAAQAAAQAAQAALQAQYPNGTGGTGLTQDQALSLLQKFAMQNYRPESALTNPIPTLPVVNGDNDLNGLNYATMVSNGNVAMGLPARDREEPISSYDGFANYLPRTDLNRLSNFSPFSPDPSVVLSDVSHRRDSSYLNSLYPLQQQHEVKPPVSSSPLGNGASKTSPTSSRPSSTSRYGRGDGPLSRPPSGGDAPRHQQQQQEYDPMHDLNNTLAHLEIDRPWKSSEHTSNGHAGQFHLTSSP